MESKTNYTFVGIMVILLSAGLLLASLWLSTGFDHQSYRTYSVYMHEAVSGLNEASLVKYNGVKVGYVSHIALDPTNPQDVYLQLQINTKTAITTGTEATLISQGITGTTYLGLSSKTTSHLPLKALPGEKYPVIPYKPSFFYQLEHNVNALSESLRKLFSPANEENIDKTLAALPKLINSFDQTLNKFNSMAGDVSSAGKQVNSTMRAGRRTIDNFSADAMPSIVSILHRLDAVTHHLEAVSASLRQNPSILLRGQTPPPLGPGE